MKQVLSSTKVKVPRGVTVKCDGRKLTVTGPRGTLERNFGHLQVEINQLGKSTIVVNMWYGNRKQLACVRSLKSHIDNMITGVTVGFQYLMRFAYAHFPINVAVSSDGRTVEIRNFLGERRVRKVPVPEGVTATRTPNTVQKDQLELTGNDIEAVGRVSSLVHQACLVKNKDIRKFLDGIYTSAKGPIGNLKAI